MIAAKKAKLGIPEGITLKKDEDGRLFIVADKVTKLDENIEINRALIIGRLDAVPKVYQAPCSQGGLHIARRRLSLGWSTSWPLFSLE